MADRDASAVKTVDKAIDMLECFLGEESGGGYTLMELAGKTGLSVSTAYRIASTLEKRRCLRRDPADKRYRLGGLFDRLRTASLSGQLERLGRIAAPHLQALHRRFNESVGVMVREGDDRTCIARIDSTSSLRNTISIGEKAPLTKGASGKVLLCASKEEELRRLLGEEAEPMLLKLAQLRRDGYAVSVGERQLGVASVAAPVLDGDGGVIAALTLTGPQERFLNIEFGEKISAVKEAASLIGRELAEGR